MVRGKKKLLESVIVIVEGLPEVGVTLWVSQLPKLLFFLIFYQINDIFGSETIINNAGTPLEHDYVNTNSLPEVGVALLVAQLLKLLFFLIFHSSNGTWGLKNDSY